MSRGRPAREPTGRNLEIYHELVSEGRQQAEVAKRFHLSQPRVAQLRRQILHWIECLLPARAAIRLPLPGYGSEASQRLHLAIALRRKQLTDAYSKYLSFFGGVQGALTFGQMLAAQDAGVLPSDIVDQLPPRTFIESAVRMASELEELARVAKRGPFHHLPDIKLPAKKSAPAPAPNTV